MLDGIGNFIVEADAVERLRELRLWHWREAMSYRQKQMRAANYISTDAEIKHDKYKNIADQHIKFVQMLNDFFDIGDTAERDNDRS